MTSTQKENMKIVIVGHVDHGKSTLIGRLFHDTGSLPEGKFEKIKNDCQKRGMEFEWSFLTDALQSERNQGVTIDSSQIFFKTAKRNYVIIDAPGHQEFLKNMITGATASEAAILMIDANEGIKENSKKHGYLLSLLGIKQVIVAINKIDLIGFNEAKFNQIKDEYLQYLKNLGIVPQQVIPISARDGDFIATKSTNFSWYQGPTILEALDLFQKQDETEKLPLRFVVQDVYKFDERRIIAGRVETGQIAVGDKIIFSPSNKEAVVKSIEMFGATKIWNKAGAGLSIGITLQDQIVLERGEVVRHVETLALVRH